MKYFKNGDALIALSDEDIFAFDTGAVPDPRTSSWKTLSDEAYATLSTPVLSAAQIVKNAIQALEASITPRRLREAVLGTDNGWMADIDERITALRAQL